MSYLSGITGIGYNPYMNPIGLTGLSDYSSYGSYYSPMNAMSGMGMYNPMMMGMYYPAFMGQMNQAYQNIEKSQLSHSSAVHDIMLQNKTKAMISHDREIFEQAMIDTGIESKVRTLHDKIVEGDQDGICEEYDKLKQTIFTKYSDYFKSNSSKMNVEDAVNKFIEELYTQQISPKVGAQVDLRGDIRKYGETAFMHGFNKEFLGKKEYHDKYTEETLSYLFGTTVDNKAGKDRIEKVGGYVGKGAEALAAGAAGYGAGLLASGITSLATNSSVKCGHWGKIAALAAMAGDICWQLTRD